MSASVLDMSVSLDGYIADPNDFLGGDDGERLHKWADAKGQTGEPSETVRQFQDEWTAAGAVLGRRQLEGSILGHGDDLVGQGLGEACEAGAGVDRRGQQQSGDHGHGAHR